MSSTSETHVAFNAPLVIMEPPVDNRMETHFVAAAECTMDTPGIAVADDLAMRFEVTYRNTWNMPLEEERPKLYINITSVVFVFHLPSSTFTSMAIVCDLSYTSS